MSDTTRFLDDLATRGFEPAVANASGALRIELDDHGRREQWYVQLDKGHITVSHEERPVNAVVTVSKELFEALASGRENATAALLRGAFSVQGDLALMIQFQRLFPGPPDGDRDVPPAGYAERLT